MDYNCNNTKGMKKNYLKLEPIISSWIFNILTQKNKLKKYIDKFGSPINIHNPKLLSKNIKLF